MGTVCNNWTNNVPKLISFELIKYMYVISQKNACNCWYICVNCSNQINNTPGIGWRTHGLADQDPSNGCAGFCEITLTTSSILIANLVGVLVLGIPGFCIGLGFAVFQTTLPRPLPPAGFPAPRYIITDINYTLPFENCWTGQLLPWQYHDTLNYA